MAMRVEIDDPLRDDVAALLEVHHAFGNSTSPPEDAHALDPRELVDPKITLVSARGDDGRLLGVGALRLLDAEHGEIKAMHVREAARGAGAGRAILDRLTAIARDRGLHRLSLETGSMDAYAAARSLYERAGFVPCPPFGDYRESPNSTYMSRSLN